MVGWKSQRAQNHFSVRSLNKEQRSSKAIKQMELERCNILLYCGSSRIIFSIVCTQTYTSSEKR